MSDLVQMRSARQALRPAAQVACCLLDPPRDPSCSAADARLRRRKNTRQRERAHTDERANAGGLRLWFRHREQENENTAENVFTDRVDAAGFDWPMVL